MTTYISMVRGINVGSKRIKMADLRDIYTFLGFKPVKTYIQSGNVIFKSNIDDPDELGQRIAQKIFETYNYHVEIVIRTMEELKTVVQSCPFGNKEVEYLHVTFLSAIPGGDRVRSIDMENINGIKSTEEFKLLSKEIYLYLPEGYGRTKLNNNFFEKKLGLNATTRNWKTVNKLLEIAESL
ncbi:protein of unknown function DUF1697 [Methanobacterium lacus]|uniref:DUF1697 domain-containing protein n=1 Tax=Methanobacterium lacus (strain AL-21) TaxID=877455 RepID=F0T609_METLA|nr:DUF1697 domain-containing protein [Methanobacterium lacus]ADZ10516.1 protein of unknown function DUF1697 [Methanobacterium lacus]